MLLLFRFITTVLRTWRIQLLVGILLAVKQSHRLLDILYDEAATIARSRYAIHAFVGENGSGKTNVMVRQATRALDRGRTVISNVPLYADKAAGVLHPNYIPFDSWNVLLDAHNCVIVMDEMTGVANARESAPLPQPIQLIFNQLRKRKITVLWSSPVFEDAQIQIRRITRAVTVCVGSWSDKAVYNRGLESADPEFDEAWIPNRLFHARTWRKTNVAEFDHTKAGQPEVDEWFWGPGSRSFETYDTNQETTRLQEADDTGLCMACYGVRKRGECVCTDYLDSKRERVEIAGLRTPRRVAGRPAVHAH